MARGFSRRATLCGTMSLAASLGIPAPGRDGNGAMIRVGLAYLARHPELAEGDALARRLAVRHGRDWDRAAIAADFAAGRTEWLGGWLFAECELLLAAHHARRAGA